MRRVVITGLGVVSCLGNDPDSVVRALQEQNSGIRHVSEYAKLGLRSCVAGIPDIGQEPPVDRKQRRFMGDAALYAYHAMRKAVDDARIDTALLSHPRTGLIVGSGVGSPAEHHAAMGILLKSGIAKVPPYGVPRIMGSTASACLATAFAIRGASYSITSACSTSAHCLGNAYDLIRFGRQDVVFSGGAEEVKWTTTAPFDAMGALSSAYNDATASRPFDVGRDGFVIAGGAAILVLEAYEHARRRGARIYAEIVGYGACSDGADMVAPDSQGAARAMRLALQEAGGTVDYINAHATSTPLGDISELAAIREAFGNQTPVISSTKGLCGHSIGAAAAQEAVFCLLMLDRQFVAGCAHVTELAPECRDFPILTSSRQWRMDTVMSNSFGFGGTNACLIFRRL